MNTVINTDYPQHPMWTCGINPKAIEQQEAEGQQQLVESCVLPIDDDAKNILSKYGVVYGDNVKGDPLFTNVTLHEGWFKRATNHEYYTELVDARGNVVADIFYKAAYYDRKASIRIVGVEYV